MNGGLMALCIRFGFCIAWMGSEHGMVLAMEHSTEAY